MIRPHEISDFADIHATQSLRGGKEKSWLIQYKVLVEGRRIHFDHQFLLLINNQLLIPRDKGIEKKWILD